MDNFWGLLGIRIDKIPNHKLKELCEVKKGWMKGLMKMFFGNFGIKWYNEMK